MKMNLATAALSFALLPLAAMAAEKGEIVYYVYFGDDKCQNNVGGVVGKVAGEQFFAVGGLSLDGKCSEEVVCLMDGDSSICESLNRTVSANAHTDVDDFGVVVECDSSNTDEPKCSAIPNECLSSSLYPNCHFRLKTEAELKRNPEFLASSTSGDVDSHVYALFFEDDQCTDLQAIKGVATGESVFTGVSSSVSCNEAVTCAMGPDGDSCALISDGNKTLINLTVKTTESGPLICLEDGSCEFAPEECVKSDILGSCHVKWVDHKTLFGEPAETLFNDKTPLQFSKPEEEVETRSGSYLVPLGSTFALVASVIVFHFGL